MTESTALQPIDQRNIPFYEDEIIAIKTVDAGVFIPLRHICTMIGIDWRSQLRRVKNDAVLSMVITDIDVTITDKYRTVKRSMVCVPLEYLNGFLFGINANRVREDLRDTLIRYQLECYKVLDNAFRVGELQIDNEQLNRAMATFTRLEERLDLIEAQLGNPAHLITASQAERISQAVKAVALELGRRSGKNEHGGVYGEVYRTYSITSYKELPASKYEDCIAMLTSWYESLTDNVVF